MVDYLALSYGLAVPAVVGVFVYAMLKGYRLRRKIRNTESFLTARNQVGPFRIAWSFYAGAVGAWVIASPAQYATFGGLLGLIMYSLASGLPFLMIAFAGDKIRNKVPHVLSLTDYIGWRFGDVAKTLVVLIALFNMSIALLAEYTTIGSIFKDFVGSVSYPMVILISVLALIYTAYGGLLVSIYTDTVQGVSSVLFFGILGIYMAATFRPGPLPTPMPCSPTDAFCISGTPDCGAFDRSMAETSAAAETDPSVYVTPPCPVTGYSSILTMPASLFTATIFSEAMWQRAWASRDRRSLRLGAVIGSVAVITVVFFAGLCGLLAAWAGLISFGLEGEPPATNPNLYLFQVLYKGNFPTIPTVSNWIGAVCVLLASIMNEGAVDSLQNGMAAGITSYVAPIFKRWTLLHTRVAVVILNGVLIGIGIWLTLDQVKVGVLELFLITNILCCSAAFPVLLGLADSLHPFFGGASFVFSVLFSIFSLCVYGVDYYFTTFPNGFEDPYIPGRVYHAKSFSSAMFYTWIGNGYQWQYFLVPLCVSLGCIGLSIFANVAISHFNLRKLAVPGFVAVATHPDVVAGGAGIPEGTAKGSDDGDGAGKEGSPVVANDAVFQPAVAAPLVADDKALMRSALLTAGGCCAGAFLLFLLFID